MCIPLYTSHCPPHYIIINMEKGGGGGGEYIKGKVKHFFVLVMFFDKTQYFYVVS